VENKRSNQIDSSCIFVIFGGTGDLTKRKLIPALFNLYKKATLPKSCHIVAIGRREYSQNEYIKTLEESFFNETVNTDDKKIWSKFSKTISYYKFDFEKNPSMYMDFAEYLNCIDKKIMNKGNRIFYLAIAPELMSGVVENLHISNMLNNEESWQRVMIEKPFGTSLKSAKNLNKKISEVLPEDKIFRIDHYLGKEMILNLSSIRFGNSIFEPLWSKNYIDHVQISSSETLGVENRGSYYDKSGILRDMIQSHILQVISLICMEPPKSLNATDIIDSKLKVLKYLRMYDENTGKTDIVLGQYGPGKLNSEKLSGYREEKNVSESSLTPTFVAMKLFVDNKRWSGVPFYIRAGKRLSERDFSITIVFKKNNTGKNYEEFSSSLPDKLSIKIQPFEGISLGLNVKGAGSDGMMQNVTLDCSKECMCRQNSPEAYERLISGVLENNHALFTRWDELMYSWKLVENIEKFTQTEINDFPNYAAGSIGPQKGIELIEKDGNSWFL